MAEREGNLSVADNVTLDSNGNGTIDFDVDNAWQRWVIDSIVVSTSQGSTQTPYPTAEVFAGPISPVFSEGATWTGNQDTLAGRVELDQGSELHVVFTGGIPGTVATARVRGKRYTRVS